MFVFLAAIIQNHFLVNIVKAACKSSLQIFLAQFESLCDLSSGYFLIFRIIGLNRELSQDY